MGADNRKYTFVNPYNFIPLGQERLSVKEESVQR